MKKNTDVKKMLEKKFGIPGIADTEITQHAQRFACFPYNGSTEHLFSSDKVVNAIEDRVNRCFSLSNKTITQYIPGVSRRDFIKTATSILAMSAISMTTPACNMEEETDTSNTSGHDVSDVSRTLSQYDIPDPAEVNSEDEATVAIVKTGDIDESVRNAIDLAGGLNEIRPGDSVLIKPNLTACLFNRRYPGRLLPVCTNAEVLRSVIRVVKEKNEDPERIFIADRSALSMPTLLIMMMSGIFEVASQEGVNVLPWEKKNYVKWQSDHARYLTEDIRIPESVLTCDHFINVPVLKNHEISSAGDQAEYTCCIKSFVGACHVIDRLMPRINLHFDHFNEKIAELNLCRPNIAMNVVDATSITLSGGPGSPEMKTCKADLVLASRDRVACDSLAVAVLRHYAALEGLDKNYVRKSVWEQKQIIHAAELGLGINDPERIQVIDVNVDEIDGILDKWWA